MRGRDVVFTYSSASSTHHKSQAQKVPFDLQVFLYLSWHADSTQMNKISCEEISKCVNNQIRKIFGTGKYYYHLIALQQIPIFQNFPPFQTPCQPEVKILFLFFVFQQSQMPEFYCIIFHRTCSLLHNDGGYFPARQPFQQAHLFSTIVDLLLLELFI